MSARATLMSLILQEWDQLRGGRYFVKRGAINWTKFNFDDDAYATAVLVDGEDLLSKNGFYDQDHSWEIAMRLPPVEQDGQHQINDGCLDELFEDARYVLDVVRKAKDGAGDNVLLKLDVNSAKAVEFHDPELGIQGIIVTFNVTY